MRRAFMVSVAAFVGVVLLLGTQTPWPDPPAEERIEGMEELGLGTRPLAGGDELEVVHQPDIDAPVLPPELGGPILPDRGQQAALAVASAFCGVPAGRLHVEQGTPSSRGAPQFVVTDPACPALQIWVDAERGSVAEVRAGNPTRAALPGAGLLLPSQQPQRIRDQAMATKLVTRWFAHAPRVDSITWTPASPPYLALNDKYWTAYWVDQERDDMMRSARISIHLDRETGALRWYRVDVPRADFQPEPAHLTRDEAVGIAKRNCPLAPGYRLVSCRPQFYGHRDCSTAERKRVLLTEDRYWEAVFEGPGRDGAGAPGTYLWRSSIWVLDRDGTVDPVLSSDEQLNWPLPPPPGE